MSKPTQGYLILTDHDRDEITIELITDKVIFEKLCKAKNHDEVFKIRDESEELKAMYADGKKADQLYKKRHFNTQTLCSVPWPFNEIKILGTYYHSEF